MFTTNTLNIKSYPFFSKYRKYEPIIIDTCIAVVSYFMPFVIIGLEPIKLKIFIDTVLIYTVVFIETFFAMKVYKNMWRFSDIEDIFKCLVASLSANILFYIITKLVNMNIFLYVYLIAFAISSLFVMAARIIYRAVFIIVNRKEDKCRMYINTMVIGAGQATAAMLNGIKSSNNNHYFVRCIPGLLLMWI